MLEHCLDADSTFGVALIKSGPEVGGPALTHGVGTMARIVQVSPVREGRIFISVYGTERFKISGITQLEPYMAAQVETLPDSDDDPPPAEARVREIRDAAEEHVRLKLGLRGGWTREVVLPRDNRDLSYHLADALQAPTAYKQKLLEEPSTARRLEREARWMESAREPLRAQVSRRLVFKSFGRQ